MIEWVWSLFAASNKPQHLVPLEEYIWMEHLRTSLERYSGEWRFTEHTAEHKHSDLQLWIKNGATGLRVCKPFGHEIAEWRDKSRIWRAIEIAKNNQVTAMLEKHGLGNRLCQ